MENDKDGGVPSLSQLIYSQPVQVSNLIPTNDINKEGDLIDDFYGLEKKRRKSPPSKAKRRKKRRRLTRQQIQQLTNEDGEECVYVLETQEEAEERERRQAAYAVAWKTQQRWKRRKVDLRNEVDEDGHWMNIVRNRMKKGTTLVEDTELVQEEDVEPSFWEQGLSAPKLSESLKVRITKQTLPEVENLGFQFPYLIQLKAEDRRVFPQLYYDEVRNTSWHYHQGTLARLTARELVFNSGRDHDMHSRLLRSLYLIDHNSRTDAIKSNAYQCGANAKLFRDFLWTDRRKAAELLGFGSQAPEKVVSTADSERRKAGHKYRKKVKTLSKKPPETPASATDPDNEQSISFVKSENLDLDSEDISTNKGPMEATLFQYEKGEVPPLPQLPLDEVDVMFCAEDKWNHVVRLHRPPPLLSDLTIYTLLSKLSAATVDGDKEKVMEIKESILSFLETIRNQEVPIVLRYLWGAMHTQLHHVQDFQSLMQYARYVANNASGLSATAEITDSGDTVPTILNDNEDKHENHFAEDVSLALEHVERREGLRSFHRIHLIYALSLVARELPLEAADIFATNDRNPVQTVRTTLEFMERNDMLVEKAIEVRHARNILSAHLEYVFHGAAGIIEKRGDSKDIDYLGWVSALRLGSLMLASGIKIGGRAFPHRSYRTKALKIETLFQSSQRVDHLPHEVRCSLPKYEEIRLETAETTRRFFQAAHSLGHHGSELIVTTLEWSQAIAQLTGPGKKEDISADTRWSRIRNLHAKHSLLSMSDGPHLREMKAEGEIDHDDLIGKLADALERNPSDVENWRRLVHEIGPLGFNLRKRCKGCIECKRLRRGLSVIHTTRDASKWWGRRRRDWWKKHLLTIPIVAYYTLHNLTYIVGQFVEQQLREVEFPEMGAPPETSNQRMDASFGWLDRTIKALKRKQESDANDAFLEETHDITKTMESTVKSNLKKDDKITPSLQVRSITLDEFLPSSFSTTEMGLVTPSSKIIDSDREDLEICAYKIFLLAHLYGAHDESVMNGVWWLASQFINTTDVHSDVAVIDDKNKGTVPCMVWLASQGLNVSQIMKDFHDYVLEAHESHNSTYISNDMKEALQLGVTCFGEEIETIRNNIPFFHDWSLRKLFFFHRKMKTMSEI